ncbi:MAG: hypothetical protein E7659_05105 [Ruminococcaceae bacterium]|nr:hypothetical protein [Oscillospiraceae bacterium]
MENESSIKEIIRNSLEQVRTIIDADTIVGKQIVTSSGMVIIPISKLSMGFASGGLDLPTKTEEGGKKNFGGGGGTGVSVVPVGFLTITPEGKVDMIPMTSEKLTPVEVVADLIYNSPDIIGRIKNVLMNGSQISVANSDVDVDVDIQPELADEYHDQLILATDGDEEAPVYDSDAAIQTEQIMYADEGERYADTKVGRKELKMSIKEQKKRDKEAAKLQKKADKSAAKMARLQAELMALNMALDAAQTPEEKEYIQNAITETKVSAQLEGEKQAEIAAQQKALAATAPVAGYAAYEVQSRKAKRNRALTPEESQEQLETEIRAFNAAYNGAPTADEKQRIIDVERQHLAPYYASTSRKADREINEFNSAMQAARTPAQKHAVIEAEKKAMLQPTTARVKTPDQMKFESDMNTLDAAWKSAKTEDEKKTILDVQKQTIINAKKQRAKRDGSADRVAYEVQAFNAALAAARTPREKHAIIQAEKKAMLQSGQTAPVLTRDQQELQSEMNTLNTRWESATTPAQQNAVIEAEKNAILKAKKKKVRGTYNPAEEKYLAEVAAFNAAYNAAPTPQAKYAVINAEKQAMVASKQPYADPADVAQFNTKMNDLNSAMMRAKTPAQQKEILQQQAQTVVDAKKKGLTKSKAVANAQAEVDAFYAALSRANTPEQQQAVVMSEATQMIASNVTPKSVEVAEFENKITNLNDALLTAKTPAQQKKIVQQQAQAVVDAKNRGLTKSRSAATAQAEVEAFYATLNRANSLGQQHAAVMSEATQMIASNTTPKSVEVNAFETKMNDLNTAMLRAETPAQQKQIVQQQAQAVVDAKNKGITKSKAVANAQAEVDAFKAALARANNLEQQQAVVVSEATQMIAANAPKSADTAAFEAKMDKFDAAMQAAQTPEQQQTILEGAKQAVIKEKRAQKGLSKNYDAATSRVYAEVMKFNAALKAAQTTEEKKAVIDAEANAMLKPQKTPADPKYTEFECEMSDLNSALANAKTRGEQDQLLEEQQQAIIKAKKRGLTKAEAEEEETVKAIAAFNAALLAAETADQQQKLIDIEKRALLKAQKQIQVKNAEQEVFEAEMSGYDEAYAAAQSDLEKLTILEAQKQAIIKAKKKGVTKAQKAAKDGQGLDDKQVRLEVLEAELVALKSALARAESEMEKRALIEAEKDALIEVKKQVALNEGEIAEEDLTQVEEAIAEPVAAKTKAEKRAERKAKKLAKKQQAVEEEDIPVPHGKRGKISEKTLDSGTVK